MGVNSLEEYKKIKSYHVDKLEQDGDNIDLELHFKLMHKKTFKILGRVLTADGIKFKYNSKIDDSPIMTLTTLRKETIENFQLKQKYKNEINDIIKEITGRKLI